MLSIRQKRPRRPPAPDRPVSAVTRKVSLHMPCHVKKRHRFLKRCRIKYIFTSQFAVFLRCDQSRGYLAVIFAMMAFAGSMPASLFLMTREIASAT